jgi:hypothetical protein
MLARAAASRQETHGKLVGSSIKILEMQLLMADGVSVGPNSTSVYDDR